MIVPTVLPAFWIAGISARTNNAREMSGDGVIGPLWQRVMAERPFDVLPNKIGDGLIAMYCDYESDASGEYTFLIGCKTNGPASGPGFDPREIAAARYVVLQSERGPVWEVVPRLWQRVWSMTPEELGGNRNYIADFEVYDIRASDPANAIVEVWIGVE